jgi:hypothetical protein
MTLWICSGVLTFFGVIAHFGWSWPVLLQRLLHMMGKPEGRASLVVSPLL